MSDRACDFNAEQASNAEQKPEEPSYKSTPYENPHIPLGASAQFQNPDRFPEKHHKWSNEDSRACICPISKLDGRVIAIRERRLDQDRVDGNGQGGEYAIK